MTSEVDKVTGRKKEYSLFTRAVFWKKILLKYISFINRAVQGIAS